MQTGSLQEAYPCDIWESGFQTAFSFLRRPNLAELPEGWVELEHGVRASVQHYRTVPGESLKFETHERCYDLHCLVRGREKIGFCPREGLSISDPYREEEDIAFYQSPDLYGEILLRPGQYALFAPEDAHRPRCLAGEAEDVIKIVVKIPVSRP